MSKVFGIKEDGRRNVPDSKRNTGFSIEEPDRRDINEILYKLNEDWRVGSEAQVIAGTANVWFDSSVPEFKDALGSTVTFLAGQTITWAGLDTLAADIDISTIDDLVHITLQGVTIDLGIYNLKLGSNQAGFLTATSSPTDETEGNISADDSPELVVNNNRTERLSDLETKNLYISRLSVSTTGITADYIRLLDSNNNAFPLGALSEVFNMATDLNAGAEKSSTTYQHWIGCDYLKNIQRLLVPDITGTSDGTSSGFLVDSANTFFTDKVQEGDIVGNTTDNTETTVATTPTSDGSNLDVVSDIFVNGDNYLINIESPQFDSSKIFRAKLGSNLNDISNDFDVNIKYSQSVERKRYLYSDGYYTITGSLWTTVKAELYPFQTKDGRWFMTGSARGDVVLSAADFFNISISGVTFDTGFPNVILLGTTSMFTLEPGEFFSAVTEQGSVIEAKFAETVSTPTNEWVFNFNNVKLREKPLWV